MADIDWGRWLRPGDRLVASHMSAEPSALLASLAASAARPAGLHLMLGVPFTEAAAALTADCTITTFGGMGSAGAIAKARPVEVSPLRYGRSEAVYAHGEWHCDVALVSLVRAADGTLFLGPSHGSALAAARRARHVIAQVTSAGPCLAGAEWPTELAPAAILETESPPIALEEPRPGPVEEAIARHVAALVRDGACLQVGIGALPSAVLASLSGHRHLGVHSGMLTDAFHRLVRSGAADSSRKTVDAGVAVIGCASGTLSLYEDLRRDPRPYALRGPDATHDAQVIARLDDMFCLNSAIEVDLLGNVNAEAVADAAGRWRFVGGVGGLPDFVRAARLARRGQAVIALPSRTPRGQPRIVARLSGPCTIAACDADVVVTDHGVAQLRDAPLGERARRMLAVAHPEDRDALRAAARGFGLL